MANIFNIDWFNVVENLTPYFWRSGGDMKISGGDLELEQSDDQNIEAILVANKGQFYESPLLGYGINKRTNGPFRTLEERKDIREALKRDNYDVKELTITRDPLTIGVDASQPNANVDIFIEETASAENNLIAFLRSVIKPVQSISDDLLALQTATITFLDYNGQHKVLEEYLNDTYDFTTRGIFITENDIASGTQALDMYLQSETDPLPTSIYLQSEVNPAPITMFLQGEGSGINSFTVNVPVAVVFDETTLRAQLSNYVIATKEYNIITF